MAKREEIILGIAPFNTSSAALFIDGQPVAAVQEERLNLIKAFSGFPVKSVAYLLEAYKLSPADIAYIAVSMPPGWRHFTDFIRGNYLGSSFLCATAKDNIHKTLIALRELFFSSFDKNLRHLGLDRVRRFHISHHLAHAASAYYPSGFKEALIVTIDGRGEDYITAQVARGKGNAIRILGKSIYPNSLGGMYAAFTRFLGYNTGGHEGHEYKVMGMAAYGNPSKVDLSGVIAIKDGAYRVNRRYLEYKGYLNLVRRFGKPLADSEKINDDFYLDLAASLQKNTEEAVANLLKPYFEGIGAGIRNLCLAGGVALNCKMNGVLLNRYKNIENIFVQPNAGDSGLSYGAAAACSAQRYGRRCAAFSPAQVYLGPEYSNDEIKATLDEYKLKYAKLGDVEEDAAGELIEGKIIGWFQGRMEWGPRALGNRSILADPSLPQMKDKINREVKRREMWRPYAVSILEENHYDYLDRRYPFSPYMTLAFPVKSQRQKEIQAAIHIDGSTRPQTVSRKQNPRYWSLIKKFGDKKGVYALLNTSFNVRDEPIVCSPKDAIRCFFSSGLDVLYMGDYKVEKQDARA